MKEACQNESPVTFNNIVPEMINIVNEGDPNKSAKFAGDSSGSCVIDDEAYITIEEGKQRYSATEGQQKYENVTPPAAIKLVSVEDLDPSHTPKREVEITPMGNEAKQSTTSDLREYSSSQSQQREPTTEFGKKESDGDGTPDDDAYALIQVPKPLEPF